LLAGAALSGLIGVAAMLALIRHTRLKDDAALCLTLSVFYGAGVALLGLVQQQGGAAAGLEGYIVGKTASMGRKDVQAIAVVAALSGLVCLALFKEFKLLCFDAGFAQARGMSVLALDAALMATVVAVTIVGEQAVGLILIVALLITPAAAARFWTDRLGRMAALSAAIGALGGYLGASASALFSKLPSGPMIVLACAAMFGLSFLFGSARGVLVRLKRRAALDRSVDRQRLLIALAEATEAGASRTEIADRLGWSHGRLNRALRRSADCVDVGSNVRLTAAGQRQAAHTLRQRRLWELLLEMDPEAGPGLVDRGAESIEEALDPETVAALSERLNAEENSVPQPGGAV
ncbi:MAG: iron chelate uptake ABC transporter family permease subunit, partial [Planctomycetota bacterium]